MKRIISLFMAISIFALTLCSCTKTNVPMPKDTKSIENNEALGYNANDVSKQGDSIYYSDYDSSIYRYDISTQKKYLINKVSDLSNFIVYNDYIYANAHNRGILGSVHNSAIYNTAKGIIRISLDAKSKTRILAKYSIDRFTIQNDKIYFTADEYNKDIAWGTLFVCDLDGKNEKKIAENAVSSFYVNDKYAYFYDSSKFYRLDLQTHEIKDIEYSSADDQMDELKISYTDGKAYVIYGFNNNYIEYSEDEAEHFQIDEIDFNTGKVKIYNFYDMGVDSLKIYKNKLYGVYSDFEIGSCLEDGSIEKGNIYIYRFDFKTGKKEDFHRYYDKSDGELEYLDDGLYYVDLDNHDSSETNEVNYLDKLA